MILANLSAGLAVLAMLAVAPGVAWAGPDHAREARLRDEALAGLFTGEAVDLPLDDGRFLALHTEPEGSPLGAVVLLHGRGLHPDWPRVTAPLRTGLAEAGWHTLSLQMPVMDRLATFYDYLTIVPEAYPRIEAGLDYLRQRGISPVILLAHSCGVHMAMGWIRAQGDHRIDGFIGVGMGATDYQQPMPQPFPLADMRVPVLDIYGSKEYPAVKGGAPRRHAAIQRAGHPRSRQVVVPNADHFFHAQEEALLTAVLDWLRTLVHGQ